MQTDRQATQATPDDPEREYRHRLEVLRETQAKHKKHDTALVRETLAALAAGVVAAVVILTSRVVSIYWTLVPLGLLVFLVVRHERVIRIIRKNSHKIAFYERGLDRITDQWLGKGERGERFADPSHPYSRDLDLFGKGSLFELLCAARTRAGEETMANWLLAPAPPDEIALRHSAVCELRNRLDLREDMAVLAEGVRSDVQPEDLAAWGEGSSLLRSRFVPMLLPFFAAAWLFGLVAWAVLDVKSIFFVASAINLSISFAFSERTRKSISAVEGAARELELLCKVFARLERETFSASRLRELQGCLHTDDLPASASLRRLNRLLDSLMSRRNLVLNALDRFLFWSLQISFRIEAWRARFGRAIRPWLAAVGQLEALSDLASFSYEHPENVFPEFVVNGPPTFDARGLAHPFLSGRQAVRNDVTFGEKLRLMLISGPNMAGKSTFLRAIGTNAVLAQSGAPVCARSLRLSPLKVGASVCVLDSLQGGVSRFYAEILRLKSILDLTDGSSAVLYLLDELLQGTNSHDRRIGAEAIVRSLFERDTIGLVTTHDLALTQIVESLGPASANFHFEDHLQDGRLIFDYHLRPGIVETSNALGLMRSIGIDVRQPDPR